MSAPFVEVLTMPRPRGFGPWEQAGRREFHLAKADGRPAIKIEYTDAHGNVEMHYWVADVDPEPAGTAT